MEQQTLSVTKAGIRTTLNTRCSVVAACNPNYNRDISNIAENLNMATSLISRFDLIFFMENEVDENQDNLMADFILNRETLDLSPNFSFDESTLREFIGYSKSQFYPKCSEKLAVIFKKYYSYKRADHNFVSQGRATVRMVESLLRLSEAHAKICFRNELNYIDIFTAIILMELSNKGHSMMEVTNTDKFLEKSQFLQYINQICDVLKIEKSSIGIHL
eukprot:NODE_20_length_44879_cov_0.624654.p25 type:complete len:218 gc:universal NODE_20_length_44879_cov_0.624654:32052-31399(-)